MTLRTYDPEHVVSVVHCLIEGLAYRLNRANGYLDRLDAAVARSVHVSEASLPALHLAADARALRALADSLDERRDALTGRAPRLRLVAAE